MPILQKENSLKNSYFDHCEAESSTKMGILMFLFDRFINRFSELDCKYTPDLNFF